MQGRSQPRPARGKEPVEDLDASGINAASRRALKGFVERMTETDALAEWLSTSGSHKQMSRESAHWITSCCESGGALFRVPLEE